MFEPKEKRKGFSANVSGVRVLGGRHRMDGGSEWGDCGGRSRKTAGLAGGTGQMGLQRWASWHHPGPPHVMLKNVHFIPND